MKKLLLVPVLVLSGFGCAPADVTQPGSTGGTTGSSGGAPGSSGGAPGSSGGTNGGSSGGTNGGSSGGTNGGSSGGTNGGSSGGATGTGGRGTGGATATGGAGGSSDAAQVAASLNFQKWLLPCGVDQGYSLLVCQNNPPTGNCQLPSATVPYLTAGTKNRDETITVGGTPGKIYTVTARIQGVVEPKHFQNGVVGTCAGAPAVNTNCGWYVGGAPQTGGNYNVYMLWVSAPAPTPTAGLAGQYFFLNNVNKTEAHFSYPIDYTVTFQVAGGAMVRFLADDSNCSAIKNCDTTSIDTVPGGGGRCNPITIPNMAAGAGVTQPYPGQFTVLTVSAVQ
jgi:hypothetical protein